MKIQVLKENLAKSIQMATKFTSQKAQIPVLGHIAIETNEKGIFVTATSMDVSIRIRMSGKIVEQGSVLVPAKIMNDLVQSLPLGGVDLESTSEGELVVKAQRTRARLQVMSVEEFPPFPQEFPLINSLSVEGLNKAYARVGFSVSQDESRPVLTGFLWQGQKGMAVATDGYRLSLSSDKAIWGIEKAGQESFIVPGKAMIQLLQVFEEFKCKSVKFGFSESGQEIMFAGEDVTGVVRTLAGEFPKYEGILPGDPVVEFRASREQLLTAVKSVAIFARDSANIIKLSLDDGKAEFSANTAQVGENVVEVEVESVKGGKGTIAFNSRYLVDFLTHSASDRVGFGMTDSLKAGLFYEVGSDEYKHVIMPVRVRS